MSKIQEELKKWADKAYNFYLPKAQELGMDFYTQSDLTLITDEKPVVVMVIGINPGHGGKFHEERFANSEDLLLGNYDFKKQKTHYNIFEWRIVRGVLSILDYANMGVSLRDESRFVLTNATFFSTHDEKGLTGEIKKAQEESIEYTKELIRIIRPKHIICLGGKNCINLLLNETKPLLENVVKLDYGQIYNIPVYGIEHTSSYWTSEEKELVGKALGRAFRIDEKYIDSEAFSKNTKGIIDAFNKNRNDREELKNEGNLRWEYIYASLRNYCKFEIHLEMFEQKENWIRYSILNQEGSPVLVLAIVNQKEKYVGVTYPVKNHPKDNLFDAVSSKLVEIDKSFRTMVNSNSGNVIWIGKLDLNNRLKDTDAFIRDTKGLIRKVVEELKDSI